MLPNTGIIRTVTGDLSADRLGHTQCHEHIYLERGASYRVNPALCLDDRERSLRELKEYYAAGGRAIVDAQPGGFGRNLAMLRDLSKESGVRIVSVSGAHKLCFLDDAKLMTEDRRTLSTRFAAEVTRGAETDAGRIPCGLLKIALDAGGLEDRRYDELYAAVAAAAAETGVNVMIHTERGNDLVAVTRFFADYGISAERLLICHLDRTNFDPAAHMTLLDAGCTLCYDSVHRLKYLSDADEIATIRRACEQGHAGQIVLSLDTTGARLRAYGATDMGLDYILRTYIPCLRENGFTDAQIQMMCTDNARRILSIRNK